ncbi:MAG: glycerol-3-phosphate acyltransferase [Actinomycetota bacterium]|nr:glycerol-3-phosphate acyltransferase [Actinomycetota bacterium]MDA3013479.1 glycerol-3-phosphate acyltransferase [Actinomycetota bacterium]
MMYFFGFLSYLIGSINFAYVVSYFKKTDISKLGSGNPGTSNVMRNFGKKYALIVLIGDVLKGVVPVLFLSTESSALIYGALAIVGHIFPIYYFFKGGKGVATYFGVYIALNFFNPLNGDLFENQLFQNLNILFLVFIYFILFKITRVSAIASLSTVTISGIILFLQSTRTIDKVTVFFVILLIFLKHKDNIKRLIEGKENKF